MKNNSSGYQIRVCGKNDVRALTQCIRSSFQDVAERFALSKENCPTHPSNCTEAWIVHAMEKGIIYYCLEHRDQMIGCVALEQPSPEIGYLERLAVLPEFRQQGHGVRLVRHIFQEARQRGISRISIAIIGEDAELGNWYEQQGFVKTGEKKFPHLPFTVQFMEIFIS